MAEKGIRGFFIHPRQGLRQPYLSEEFFRMVEVAVDAAEQYGLLAHLYDEYPYPSGIAGGEVVLGNPRFYATALVQKTLDLPSTTTASNSVHTASNSAHTAIHSNTSSDDAREECAGSQSVYLRLPRGKVLSCMLYALHNGQVDWTRGRDLRDYVGMSLVDESYNETGLTSYNRKRYFASNPTPILAAALPPGSCRLFVSVQVVVESHKYWGNFVDVLNPEAVRSFLQLTHERYYRRLGHKFGKGIGSIFVDETAPGWSALLPEAFQQEYGYDLLPLLPALQDSTHPAHLQVENDLARLRYRLFCHAFEEPLAKWCASHGLRYSGEKPSLRLSQLRYMDIPGCDAGHTKAGARMDLLGAEIRGNARAASSAAYFYGKEGTLCECYHSLGWSATLQDVKLIAEGLLLMGVRYLVPHGFFYSTHALKKHDAPPTFFFQMPYWELFGHLTHRLERMAQYLENTYIDAQILLFEPSSGIPTRKDREVYQQIQEMLMQERLEFLIVDTEILQSGQVENGSLRIREITARVILLPPMRLVEPPLQAWLESFEQAGGIVLRCGPTLDREAIVSRLRAVAPPTLHLYAYSGDVTPVQMTARRGLPTPGPAAPSGDLAAELLTPDSQPLALGTPHLLWLLLHTGNKPVDLILETGYPLREIPLDDSLPAALIPAGQVISHTGSPSELPRPSQEIAGFPPSDHLDVQRSDPSLRRYSRTLAPFESILLASDDPEVIQAAPPERPSRVSIPVGGAMKVSPRSANLLRMYHWEMALMEDSGQELEKAIVPAVPLANQLEKGRFRFSPAIQQFFGAMPQLRLPSLHLCYRFWFQSEYVGPIELVMEPGSILGEWQIQVNHGHPLQISDFTPTASHVRGSLGVDISSQLQPGQNVITIQVRTDRLDGGLRNALYLAGNFGVYPDPLRLAPRPETGAFEAWEDNGLPYYAGVVEYEMVFHLEAIPAAESPQNLFQPPDTQAHASQASDIEPLTLPPAESVIADLDYQQAPEGPVTISLNGGPWRPVLWTPYSVLLPRSELKQGPNTLRLRVYTSLIRAFEGQWFDSGQQCCQDIDPKAEGPRRAMDVRD